MKITKEKEKLHDEALAILSLSRKLNFDEIEKVYAQYNPMATHRVSKGAIYFTPTGLCRDLATMARIERKSSVLDLCAGIGGLTWEMQILEAYDGNANAKRHVCVEIDPEFCDVGKKLIPDVEWIRGDVFDQDLMRSLGEFDLGISNPPFGHVPGLDNYRAWSQQKHPAHLATVDVLLRMCHTGIAILPENSVNPLHSPNREQSRDYSRFVAEYPGVDLVPIPVDVSRYEWNGANPNVLLCDISTDDSQIDLPRGWPLTPSMSASVQLTLA
jgi:predicted RNA methylase